MLTLLHLKWLDLWRSGCEGKGPHLCRCWDLGNSSRRSKVTWCDRWGLLCPGVWSEVGVNSTELAGQSKDILRNKPWHSPENKEKWCHFLFSPLPFRHQTVLGAVRLLSDQHVGEWQNSDVFYGWSRNWFDSFLLTEWGLVRGWQTMRNCSVTWKRRPVMLLESSDSFTNHKKKKIKVNLFPKGWTFCF